MLGGIRVKVSLTHEKTCFAYISPKYSSNSQQTQCVQVLCKNKQILLWVVFSNNVSEGQIACNPIYGRLIGLQEGLEVFVSPYSDVQVLEELHVDADSPDDQEILEHNAELLQLRVLDQLRLVVANQKAVVWISTSLPIIFTPKQTGILVNHSRIIVKVDAFNSMQGLKTLPLEKIEDVDSKFKNIGILHYGMLHKYLNVPEKHVFRTLSIDSDGKRNLNHPYTVFVNECFLENVKEKTVIATIKTIPSILLDDNENDSENNNNSLLHDLLVEVVPITNVIYRSLCREIHDRAIPTMLIPKTLHTLVSIDNGSKIILTIVKENIEVPDNIEIVTYSEQTQTETDVIEKFKHTVIKDTHDGKKFLINDGIIHQNVHISHGFLQLKLKPEKLKYSLLNPDSFRHCAVSAKCLNSTDFIAPKPNVSNLDYDCMNYCRTVKSMESLVDKVLSHLYFEIHRDANFKNASEIKSNVLVTGLGGTGKTALCHIIQKELTVYSHILHCRSLKGRKDITEVLGKAILMCQERSPSVLICDDVDALVPPNMEGASPQDIAYYQRLAVVIKQQLQSCCGVVVLMTSQSTKELHPTLRQFSGKPLFTAQFGMPELEQIERVELFEHMLNDRIREEFRVEDDDVIRMAMETTGCSVREVTDYFHKRIFKAVKKKKNHPTATPRLVDDVTADSDRSDAFDIWGPVGGLDDVKRGLTETIFWPIMYPALFPSQSCGILLYGPPGTGKSHIGSCLARLTNMNLIAVKGPELLSKYIGQSEKAVRDIFDKADMKRPCILFFDEFDSLAPKRGHDSTGVTDRVVNQLLTGLDGAEGGARCAVVAASSRPDLIDPALLRPGRLHTHLYCSLPDQCGRHEVLRTLSKSVTIDTEVDLEQLSVRTEGYSPADLKSLLVTAQLTRLEKQLEAQSEEKSMESVVVYQEDIESALLETKPSLSKEQKLFYDMIYRRFRGEPLTPEQRVMSSRTMEKQRVTLA